MKNIYSIFFLLLVLSCSTQKTTQSSYASDTKADFTERDMADENSYLLTSQSEDLSYGFSKENPVMVGGANIQSGPSNERRFLNALRGPNGELVQYYRKKSCCAFKTPNGFDNTGFLDVYVINWIGNPEPLELYINMYDKDELFIPVGLSAVGK